MILTQEGDRMVHKLASLDRVESPEGHDNLYNDWEGGTKEGPKWRLEAMKMVV